MTVPLRLFSGDDESSLTGLINLMSLQLDGGACRRGPFNNTMEKQELDEYSLTLCPLRSSIQYTVAQSLLFSLQRVLSKEEYTINQGTQYRQQKSYTEEIE